MKSVIKKILFLSLMIFCLSSCTSANEENSTINEIGSWKLIAVLADPGDGSGVFQPVLSDKTIIFETNVVAIFLKGMYALLFALF